MELLIVSAQGLIISWLSVNNITHQEMKRQKNMQP